MAEAFAKQQRQQAALAGRMMPKVEQAAVLPRESRAAIVQLLEAAGMPLTEEAITQVYRAYLEGQKAAR
jgi:hypothetical protein